MKTSQIPSQTISQSVMPKASTQSSGADNMPFKQVLSREVSERREDAQQTQAETGKPKAAEGPTAATGPVKASNEHESQEADKAANVPGNDDTAAGQLLALAAQLAQFNTIEPEAGVAGAVLQNHAEATALSSVRPDIDAAKLPPAKDTLAALTDERIFPDGDFGHQLGAAADKAQQLRAGMPAAVLAASTAAAQQLPIDQMQDMQNMQAVSSIPGAAPAQQIAAGQAQAAAGPLADMIAPQVGSKGWDQALAQKVVWMVAGAQQSASLTLNPPDLGPLQVVLSVSNAQATANFVAAQPEVRQALEAAMPRLREMMQEAGIALGQANVSAGNPQQQAGHGGRRQNSSASGRAEPAGDVSIGPSPAAAAAVRHGLVDTFA